MSEKDFSKLRPFDLEAAKAGDAFGFLECGELKPREYIDGPDSTGAIIVKDERGNFQISDSHPYNMAPLAWVEGKPVYKGDVLWHIPTGEKHYADRYDAEQDWLWQDSRRDDSVSGFLFLGSLTWEPPGKAAQQPSQSINNKAPKIGEKWPGLSATYAGISLSKDGNRLVYLILWDEATSKCMTYEDAVAAAEKINPAMESHLPTRHQGIDLFNRLQHLFDQDYWEWLLEKTKSGKAAFIQHSHGGYQYGYDLSFEGRVRAVSEIPL